MVSSLYPLCFTPLLKERIWGGDSIQTILKKDSSLVNKNKNNLIGESWEICDRNDDQSIVNNGYLKGKTIREVIATYKNQLLGSKLNTQTPFPLLVKILDATEDLSLQIHPSKSSLPSLPKDAQSKTEFWYILQANADAMIMCDIKNGVTKEEFTQKLNSIEIKSLVNEYQSQKDMLFYVESGTVHALGKGNLVLEIQENSDTTYRLSDWERVDTSGNKRELHLKEGLFCIDFSHNQNKHIPRVINNNISTTGVLILNSDCFSVYNNHINSTITKSTSSEVCEVLSVTSGSIDIAYTNQNNAENILLNMGDSCLLPASISCNITPITTEANFLTTLPKGRQ